MNDIDIKARYILVERLVVLLAASQVMDLSVVIINAYVYVIRNVACRSTHALMYTCMYTHTHTFIQREERVRERQTDRQTHTDRQRQRDLGRPK